MNNMLSYCGLTCNTCPIHLATRQENPEERTRMRAEIVRQCEEHYGIRYRLDEITDCDGCRTEGGRLFSASKNCLIRKCAREKKLESCAHCPAYACEKLKIFFMKDPGAKTRLDEVRLIRRRRP